MRGDSGVSLRTCPTSVFHRYTDILTETGGEWASFDVRRSEGVAEDHAEVTEIGCSDSMQAYNYSGSESIMLELTMIPAQCGVSLSESEGLMANIRKATTVTATPNSSWNRATSRGKRQTLHFLLSSGPGLSSLFFCPSLSEEPFRPCPIFTSSVVTVFSFSLLSSSCCSVWAGWACPLSASLPLPSPPCRGLLSP